MSATIGVVGVGRMGAPICVRLAESGHIVTAFDLDSSAVGAVAGAGVSAAASLEDLATASADFLITILPGPVELSAVMSGPDGLLQLLPQGSCWIDVTSGAPDVATRLAAEAATRGISAVSAPMGGGPNQARAGTLQFFIGGQDAAVARALPVLACLGNETGIERAGTNVADGHTVKLLTNLLWFGQVVAVTEALLLGQSLGVDLRVLRRALARGAGGSAFIDRHLDALLAGDYLETFGLDRCVEELETVTRLAAAAESPFELSSLVTHLHAEALAKFGPVNGELLAARLLEDQAGRVLRLAD
jgi:3-hydroxyisobutyrate dehydrogenase